MTWPPLETLLRLGLAALLAALAVPAYRYADLSYTRINEPARAYRIRPDDAFALAHHIETRLEADATFVPAGQDLADLRQALIARPLEPHLLAAHGLVSAAQQQPTKALAAMQLADRVSRRGSLASVWLIEAASNAGDVSRALRHYHNVLSVHPELGPALLPVLARGAAFPEIRAALAPYLARPTSWTGPFLEAALKETAFADLQALLTPLPASLRDEAYQSVMARIGQRMAVEGGAAAAERFFAGLIPGFDKRALTLLTPLPAALDARLGPLGWHFPNEGGIVVEATSNGAMELTVEPLANGTAAVRDILVESGKQYAFSQRIAVERLDDLMLTWSATCKGPNGVSQLWQERLGEPTNGATRTALLAVPNECSVLTFALQVEGPDGQSPATVSLNGLELQAVK